MQSQYNIAIQPSKSVNALVKRMKERLADNIGWFASKNSEGHITLSVFKATDEELDRVKQQVTEACQDISPVDLVN